MRLFFILILLTFGKGFAFSQAKLTGKDLPDRNLFIVVFDKTGSMSGHKFGGNRVYAMQALTLEKIKKFFPDTVKLNFKKDSFFFYTFGLGTSKIGEPYYELGPINRSNSSFTDLLIHDVYNNSEFRSFSNFSELLDACIGVLALPNAYNYSFTTLAKYMALKKLLERLPGKPALLESFKKIFVGVITDNGEESYQWLPDRETIRWILFDKEKEVLETVNLLETNNFSSASKNLASFQEILVTKDKGLKFNLYEFRTKFMDQYSGDIQVSFDEPKLNIQPISNNSEITHFVTVDSILINAHITKDTVLVNPFELPLPEKLELNNRVRYSGEIYESYVDSILGKRYRSKKIVLSMSAWSKNAKTMVWLLVLFFTLLLGLVLYYVLYFRPNQNVVVISDAMGNEILYKRKELFKTQATILQYLTFVKSVGSSIMPFIKVKNKFHPGELKNNSINMDEFWIRIEGRKKSRLKIFLHEADILKIANKPIIAESASNQELEEITGGTVDFSANKPAPYFRQGWIKHILPTNGISLFSLNRIEMKNQYNEINFIGLDKIAKKTEPVNSRAIEIIRQFIFSLLTRTLPFAVGELRTILRCNDNGVIYWIAFEANSPSFNLIKIYFQFRYKEMGSEVDNRQFFENLKRDSEWEELVGYEEFETSNNAPAKFTPRIIEQPCMNFILLAYPDNWDNYSSNEWDQLACVFNPFTDFGKSMKEIIGVYGVRRVFIGASSGVEIRNTKNKALAISLLQDLNAKPIEINSPLSFRFENGLLIINENQINLIQDI